MAIAEKGFTQFPQATGWSQVLYETNITNRKEDYQYIIKSFLSKNASLHALQCCGSESESERIRKFWLDPNPKKSSDTDSDSDPDTVVE
jgi:hypothetical protein